MFFLNGSIISKWRNSGSLIFLYPGDDPDHCENLMGSKLDQYPSVVFV